MRSKLAAALASAVALCACATTASAYEIPPADAGFDYQIGGDYELPDGVDVVSRDWFSGDPASGAYNICYVNAYQTQANERGTDRPDEQSNWPRNLVLEKLGDDPKWGGEYLVDISTVQKRERAAEWVDQMIQGCADKGYDAVEYDNLDSWTRFNGTPLAKKVPFEKEEAAEFAEILVDRAHALDMAVGQKNTVELAKTGVEDIGFDFAIAEECGRYKECDAYTRHYDDHLIAIEYRRKDFRKTCDSVGDEVSVVLRDRNVSKPGGRKYVYDAC